MPARALAPVLRAPRMFAARSLRLWRWLQFGIIIGAVCPFGRAQIHRLTDRRGRLLRLRVTGGPRHDSSRGEAWIGRPPSCVSADRTYEIGVASEAGHRGGIPARARRTQLQPRAPARYRARHAAARGRGWLEHERRVATRSASYARRLRGFPYLAAAWLWLHSNFNAAQGIVACGRAHVKKTGRIRMKTAFRLCLAFALR